jgi:hypothetical protein
VLVNPLLADVLDATIEGTPHVDTTPSGVKQPVAVLDEYFGKALMRFRPNICA